MAEIVDGKIKLSIRATEIESAVAQTTTNANQIATLTTSVENKVDKVVGKSLVDDTEIERLASVENYDDTILLWFTCRLFNNLSTLFSTDVVNVAIWFAFVVV